MEKRGNTEEARKLYASCVQKDPALNWPAYFSKQKLNDKSFGQDNGIEKG